MTSEVLQVLSPGLGATIQDQGRVGWRRFGVPSSGAMDDHAALWANRLLDNPPAAPVLELLLQGAKLSVVQDVWVAITGADAETNVALWRSTLLKQGQVLEFRHPRAGVWAYLAVEGGFDSKLLFGSASVYARGGIGLEMKVGDTLSRLGAGRFQLPAGVAGRTAPRLERRHYANPPTLRVWPAPQTGLFSPEDQRRFFAEPWTITPRSDRVGYRLAGNPLVSRPGQILSEPVRVGTIQVPEDGLPIVTMRDGPTVGGYPKLGVLDPGDVSWFAQCQPGHPVRFQPANEA